jgi:hypothetical protein
MSSSHDFTAFKSVSLNSENFLRTENDRLAMMIPDPASTGRHSRERCIIPRFSISSQNRFLSLQAPALVPQITNG